jgi:NTP pyrophosphatase (non-canonical NTP hydrolase)
MTIRELQQRAWQVAEDKGFHDDLEATSPRHATMIRAALIHTEVTEALGELLGPLDAILQLLLIHRTASNVTQLVKKQAFPAVAEALGLELADIVIRVADLAGTVGIDLQDCIEAKQAYNTQRPHLYGTPEEGTQP